MRNSFVASILAFTMIVGLNGCGKIPTWGELTGQAKPQEPPPAAPVAPVQPAAEPVQVPQGPNPAQVIAAFKSIPPAQMSDSALQQLTSLNEGLDQITEINADQSKVSNAGLSSIDKLPNLTILRLDSTGVNDEGCQFLGRATSLKTLSLSNTTVSAVGAAALTSLVNLNHLSLDRCHLTREGYDALGTLPSLVSVSLVACGLDNVCLERLCNAKTLEYLKINDNGGIDDNGLVALRKLENLTGLEIASANINGAGLLNAQKGGGLRSLKTLVISRCPIGQQGGRAIAGFKNLERLNLGEIASMNDQGLKMVLSGMKQLKYLNLSKSSALDGTGLDPLANHKELEELYIDGCSRIGDGVVKILKTIKTLKDVRIGGTAITANGISQLKLALPDAQIH